RGDERQQVLKIARRSHRRSEEGDLLEERLAHGDFARAARRAEENEAPAGREGVDDLIPSRAPRAVDAQIKRRRLFRQYIAPPRPPRPWRAPGAGPIARHRRRYR